MVDGPASSLSIAAKYSRLTVARVLSWRLTAHLCENLLRSFNLHCKSCPRSKGFSTIYGVAVTWSDAPRAGGCFARVSRVFLAIFVRIVLVRIPVDSAFPGIGAESAVNSATERVAETVKRSQFTVPR